MFALVDVAVVTERYIGARALWRTETFRELFVTFADPEVIGMSAIAGLLTPVTRLDKGGLHVRLAPEDEANIILDTPIAPGYMRGIGIRDYVPMKPNVKYRPSITDGSIALDGERELSFTRDDDVTIELLDVNFSEHRDAEEAKVRFQPNGTADEFTIVFRIGATAVRKVTLDIVTGLPSIEVIR